MSSDSFQQKLFSACTVSSDSSEDSFLTALQQSQVSSNKDNRVEGDDHGYNIDTLLDRYGFFLVTKKCRAVCIKNGPNTIEEIEKASNLKATIPEWLQNKIQPKPKCDDEIRGDLLVTLNDLSKNRRTGKRKLTGKENAPIQPDSTTSVPMIEIVSNNEKSATKDVVEEASKRPLIEQPKCDQYNENGVRLDCIDKGKVTPAKPASTGMISQGEENVISAVTLRAKTPELNTNQALSPRPPTMQPLSPRSPTMQALSPRPPTMQALSPIIRRGHPYLGREEKAILRYILDGNFEAIVKGNTLWMKMEEDRVCPGRTWQSMKNRFRKSICNSLSRPEFKLTGQEILRIKKPRYEDVAKGQMGIMRNQWPKKVPTGSSTVPERYHMTMDWSDDDTNN